MTCASASWGSDAVSGVVNFVTDKRFEGFKSNMMAGGSGYGVRTLIEVASRFK